MSRMAWRLWVLCLLAGTLVPPLFAADAEVQWHENWAAVTKAAQRSGKSVLVYVYERGQPASDEMSRTWDEPEVAAAVQAFEPYKVNGAGSTEAEANFCEQYHVGVHRQKLWNAGEQKDQIGASTSPVYLFLDANGREYFRAFGFYPPPLFVQLLGRVSRLIQYLNAFAQRPNDARLNADLGNLYLNLDQSDQGTPYLSRAVQLDPENAAGARADAELDLIILSIPQKPEQAVRDLVAYRFNYPETKRALEMKYYMAVAEYAAGHQDRAQRILEDFAAIPPWIPNLGRPGKKKHNPDYYHNQWCEAADVLLNGILHPGNYHPPKPPPEVDAKNPLSHAGQPAKTVKKKPGLPGPH